ncbi:MAG: hypothetical protein PHX92_01470, partial [Candidatus Pacebacteria bacterium]|nr:hypothetical protein [Candidatus Paceibacterota bacterium]
MKKTKTLGFLLGIAIMSTITGYLVFGWTEPTLAPPNGNVSSSLSCTEEFCVTDTGVGIGTTNPEQKLDVNGIGDIMGAYNVNS